MSQFLGFIHSSVKPVCGSVVTPQHSIVKTPQVLYMLGLASAWWGGGGGGNSLYFVWYRRAAGIAPIFQVIYTLIDNNFVFNIHL